ncbi:MAG: hypothetical protein R2697_15160 [Ilumatobacteraceae bacterium]
MRVTLGARMKTPWNGAASGQDRHREVGLERVELAAVAVALHRDVDGAERPLVGAAVERLGGEQDHAGARAEDRHAVGDPLGKRFEQFARQQEARHRGRLAAGHGERRRRRSHAACAPDESAPSSVSRCWCDSKAPLQREDSIIGVPTWGLLTVRDRVTNRARRGAG